MQSARKLVQLFNIPAVAFGADKHLVGDYPGIDDKGRKTSAAKTGETFPASQQIRWGLPAFYTDCLAFLSHNFSPGSGII
jgi:hypothetical protein